MTPNTNNNNKNSKAFFQGYFNKIVENMNGFNMSEDQTHNRLPRKLVGMLFTKLPCKRTVVSFFQSYGLIACQQNVTSIFDTLESRAHSFKTHRVSQSFRHLFRCERVLNSMLAN